MSSRSAPRNAALLGPSVNQVVSKQSPTPAYSAAPIDGRYCTTFFFTGTISSSPKHNEGANGQASKNCAVSKRPGFALAARARAVVTRHFADLHAALNCAEKQLEISERIVDPPLSPPGRNFVEMNL